MKIRERASKLLAVGALVIGAAIPVAVFNAPVANADGCGPGVYTPWGGGQRCAYTAPDGTLMWCDSGGGGAFGIWVQVTNNCYPAPPPPAP